jgi:hypothetical protein
MKPPLVKSQSKFCGTAKEVYKQRAVRWGMYSVLLLLGMLGWAIAATLSVRTLLGLEREPLVTSGWLVGALEVLFKSF